MTDKTYPILIFADGASSGNPGPGGWGSIIATPAGEVLELGGSDPQTTNNRMELMAAIKALESIASIAGPVAVHTDSVYVIRGITQWIWGWRRNGWKTAQGGEVINQDLWQRLSAVLAKRGREHPVDWKYVRGHSGIPGNERVDEIAVSFSKGRPARLYSGPLLSYPVAIHDLPDSGELPDQKPRQEQEKKAAAFSYLSLLGASPLRHRNWASCERRVKGQSGAKFKKAMSAQEEVEILKSWGFTPKDLKDAP